MNATLPGYKRKHNSGDSIIINKRFKLTIKEPIRSENVILNNHFPPASTSSTISSPTILPAVTTLSDSPGPSIISSVSSTPGIRTHLDLGKDLCIMEPEGMDSISRKHRSALGLSGSSSNTLSSSSSGSSSHKKTHSIATDKGRRLTHELRECRSRLNELKNSPEWGAYQASMRQIIQNDQSMSKYPTIIRRILDLPTIEKYLDDGVYSTAREFDADIILMLDNAINYHTKMNTPYKAGIVPNAQSLKKAYLPYERWTIIHNRIGGAGGASHPHSSSSSSSSGSGSSSGGSSHRHNDDYDDDLRQVASPTSGSGSGKKKSKNKEISKIDKLEKIVQGLGETVNDIKKRPQRPLAAPSPRNSAGATTAGAATASAGGSGATSRIARTGSAMGLGPKRSTTAANYKAPNGVKYGSFTKFKSTIDLLPRQKHYNLLSKVFQLVVTPALVDKDNMRHVATSVDIDFELLSESLIKSMLHEANDIIKKERTARQKEDQYLPSQPRVGGPPGQQPFHQPQQQQQQQQQMQPQGPSYPNGWGGPRHPMQLQRGPLTPLSPHSPMGHTPPIKGQFHNPIARPPGPPGGPLHRVTTFPPPKPAGPGVPPAPPKRQSKEESDSDSDSDAGSDSDSDSGSDVSDSDSDSSPDSPAPTAAPMRPAAFSRKPQLPQHMAASMPGRYNFQQQQQNGGVAWNIGNRGANATAAANKGESGDAFSKFQAKMKEQGEAKQVVEEEEKKREAEKKQSEERRILNGTADQQPTDDLF